MKFFQVFGKSQPKKSPLRTTSLPIPEPSGGLPIETGISAEILTDLNKGGVEEWELRPGGMLVQKRRSFSSSSSSSSPQGKPIRVWVSFGTHRYHITIAQRATFGDMKWILVKVTGLQPKEQRLLYKGKEREDNDQLHIAGVEDESKIILVEDPESKERKMQENEDLSEACHAVALVREEVDKLAEQFAFKKKIQFVTLERLVSSGSKVDDRDYMALCELFMIQLLKLDTINAQGKAKVQRRLEVQRVQNFIEAIDGLKLN